MKKISISALTLVVLGSFVLTAAAQDRVLGRAYIPFKFDMHGQNFNAGTYELRQIGAQLVRMQRVDTRRGVSLTALQPIDMSNPINLTFHKYDNRYFLASVAAPSYQMYLPKSQSEKAIEAVGFNLKTTTLALK